MKNARSPYRCALLALLVVCSSVTLSPAYRMSASAGDAADCVVEEATAGHNMMDMVVHLLDPEEDDLMDKLWWLGNELTTWGTNCAVSETKLSALFGVLDNTREINRIYEKYGGNAPPLDADSMWDWAKLVNAGVQLGYSLNSVGKGAAALNAAIVATPALGVVMLPFISVVLLGLIVLPILGGAFSWINGNLFITRFLTSYIDYTYGQRAIVQAWAQDRPDIVVPGDQVSNPYEYLHLWRVGFQDGERLYKLLPDHRLRLLSDGTYALDLFLFFYTMSHPPYIWSVGNDLEVAVEMEFEGGEIVPVTDGFVRPYEGSGFQTKELYGFTQGAEPFPLTTLHFPTFSAFPKDIVYRFRHPSLAAEPIEVVRVHPFHPVVVEGTGGSSEVLVSGCAGETIPFSFELSTHPGWIWSWIETHETAGTANDPGSTSFWTSDVLKELGDTEDPAQINAELDTHVPSASISLPARISVDSQGTAINGHVRVPTETESGAYGFWVLCTSERGGTVPVHVRVDVSSCDAIAPGSLSAVGTGVDIDLAWQDNSDDESGFEIWKREGSSPYGGTYYARVPANTESFTDTDVTGGTTYAYKARAFMAGSPESYSEFSNEATADPGQTVPSPPTSLSVRETNNAVVLDWTDTSGNETGFEIWRRVGDGAYGESYYSRVNANVTEWTDSVVSVGATYTYKVRAYSGVGPSEFCAERGCSFWGAGVAAPSELTAHALSDHSVYLTWRDNSGNEENYVIERKEQGDRYFGIVKDDLPPNTESFNDVYALDPETTYVYRVRAENPSGSSFSNEAACTTNSELSGMAATPWPTGHQNERRTGSSPGLGTLVPNEAWRRWRLGGASSPYYASPVVGEDGTVYIARGQRLYALDAETGLERPGWPFVAYNEIQCTPSIDSNGRIYFGDTDGWLYAVRPDGGLDWPGPVHLTPGRDLHTSPAFIRFMDEIFVLVTNGPNRFKLRPDGSIFHEAHNSFTYGSPAVDAAHEFFVCGAGPNAIGICDFDLNCWECDMTGVFPGSFEWTTPIGDNGLVYATNTAGYLLVYDPLARETKWFAKVTQGGIGFEDQPPVLGPDGLVYCIDFTGVLHAWQDQGDVGVKRWDLPLGHSSFQVPIIDKRGTIYVATSDAKIKAIRDLGDRGVVLWSYCPQGDSATPLYTSSSIDGDGRVFFSTPTNFVALYGQDTLAPQTVANLQLSEDPVQQLAVSLTWTNPTDSQLAEVVVRQQTGAWPANHLSGGLTYQDLTAESGGQCSVSIGGLEWGVDYRWAVFVRDLSGNWRETVVPGENALSTTLPPPDTPATFRVDAEGDVFADGTVHAERFEPCTGCADVAEWVTVSGQASAGDVLEHDPSASLAFRRSQSACSRIVAGVVATKPGIVLGGATRTETSIRMALIGIVAVKVSDEGGPIQLSDLLVTSSTPGHAMRWAGPGPCPCSLVGKALEPMADERGVILVLLTAH